MKNEEKLHIEICSYLKQAFPDVIFFSEPSGLRLSSWHQRKLLKKIRSVGKLPDIFIAFPVEGFDQKGRPLKFHGFFLELKAEGTTIFKKDGEVVADQHIRDQRDTLIRLFKLGYAASFGIGFDQCKKIIDDYMDIPNRKNKQKINN